MYYHIVNKTDQTKLKHPRTRKDYWDSERGAKIALASIVKITGYTSQDLVVMEHNAYEAQVPMREVTNLMTGEKVMERADLPWGCSVTSESYWSS
jgi:hypothetical protein